MAKKQKTEEIAHGATEKPVDFFEAAIHTITSTDSEEVRAELARFHNEVDGDYFWLGGYLSRIQDDKLWKNWGFDSFNHFVTSELGFKPRKALYLVMIYDRLVSSEVPWEAVKSLSWPRLKEIAPILTKGNAAEWVEKAGAMTLVELQQAVMAASTGKLESSGVEPEKSKSVNMTFKVHEDQKETIQQAVEKAKKEAETEYDGVALEAICIDYLAGGKGKAQSLKTSMKKAGYLEVLDLFDKLWPEINLDVTVPSETTKSEPVVVVDDDL